MRIVLDSSYNWETAQQESFVLHRIGHKRPVDAVLDFLKGPHKLAAGRIGEILSQQVGNFAVLIEGLDFVLAFVDTVRSYPIFYTQDIENLVLSNSARRARDEGGTKNLDHTSLLEFSMAGYVTGRETVYENLFQLQAGELLLWDKTERNLVLERYYRYYPQEVCQESETAYIDQFSEVVDRVFRRVIENANGAPIWVPLSGGLDSRLVICKLKQLGYDRLTTFSYGPRGNYEAKAARYVADKLEVPWIFVPPKRARARKLFQSPIRKRYWAFADGLSSIPVLNEFEVLLALRERGELPDDAVLVNGQSGDFLTGGHIPISLIQGEPSVRKLLDAIISKHFSIWMHLKTEANLTRIENKILRLLQCSLEDACLSREQLAAQHECWEWQERQCKYVVNGQRLYDFLGLAWELPHWDAEFLRFWERVPLEQRFGQTLYRRYLERFNYKGLFEGYRSESRRWPGLTALVVPPVAKMIILLFGQEYLRREYVTKFFKYASYLGHYSNYYALYGFRHFLKNIPRATVPPQARGVVALSVEIWLRENGIGEIPQE